MSSPPASRLPLLLAIPLLLVSLIVAPAHALDPIGTTTAISVTGGNKPGDLLTVKATVTSSAGVPTGSVRFTGNALDVTVPLGANGTATTQTPAATATEPIAAEFSSSDGFLYSMDSERPDIMSRIRWEPEPTVARLVPPRLTLTTAVRLRDRTGQPRAGVTVDFSLVDNYPVFAEPGRPFPVCTAVTDATGFASCKGAGAAAAVVSLLLGGAFATEKIGFFHSDQWTKLPVFLR